MRVDHSSPLPDPSDPSSLPLPLPLPSSSSSLPPDFAEPLSDFRDFRDDATLPFRDAFLEPPFDDALLERSPSSSPPSPSPSLSLRFDRSDRLLSDFFDRRLPELLTDRSLRLLPPLFRLAATLLSSPSPPMLLLLPPRSIIGSDTTPLPPGECTALPPAAAAAPARVTGRVLTSSPPLGYSRPE